MARLLFLIIFGVAGCAVLLGLGFWQVERLAWKQSVLAEIDARIVADPVALPQTFDQDADRYMPVTVSGEIGARELHVLVSRKLVGAGYLIISEFTTDDGRRILIDRGFVSTPDKNTARATGPATITGNLHWPREVDQYTPAPDPNSETWFARDVPAMAAELGTEPVLIVAKTQTDPAVTPIVVDTSGIPNDHLGYAVTWFSLAAIWAAMTLAFLWRTRAVKKG